MAYRRKNDNRTSPIGDYQKIRRKWGQLPTPTYKQLKEMAQKVNEGVEYALSDAEKEFNKRDIRGYQIYREYLPLVETSKILKKVDRESGAFTVKKSYKNLTAQEKKETMAALDYLASNRAMSEANWKKYYIKQMNKNYNGIFRYDYLRKLSRYEALMWVFQTPEWQAIRAQGKYDLEEMADAILKVDKVYRKQRKSREEVEKDIVTIVGESKTFEAIMNGVMGLIQ